jgi:hypothetical protein
MSLFPDKLSGLTEEHLFLFQKDEALNGTIAERELLVGKPNQVPKTVQNELAELIVALFFDDHPPSHHHPPTNPKLPPEKRGKRHRNYYIYELNQFRHWWKTSRLLLRLAGGLVFCGDDLAWEAMATFDVSRHKQARRARKMVKNIGRGGPIAPFLAMVHPFTRTLRIVLAFARAWEAKVDNRLYEVGLAEAL